MGRYSDDDDRGSRRSRDDDEPRRGRDRDDDRGSRRSSRDDDDDRGSRRGGGGGRYTYQARSADQNRRRSEQGPGDFDRFLKDSIKVWKVNDGNNTIRPLPPTWKGAEHFGYDIFVHYGVGPDRGTYLCPNKMQSKPCPICEERTEAQRAGDEAAAKKMEPKRRVLIYLIDRDKEKDGVQAWAMPWTLDRDISKVSQDRRTGEVLPIDHPEEGFDVMFEKKGAKDRTEYLAAQLDRRPSDLGKSEWLDFAVDHPLPDQLVFYDYDHIAKAFNGGGKGGGGGGGRYSDDDDRDSRSSHDRDDDRPRRSSRDEEEPRRRSSPEYDFNQVQDMSSRELDALADEVGVNASKYNDDNELADAICEKLGLKAEPRRRSPGRDEEEDRPRRSRDDDDEPRSRSRGDDDSDDRLRRMRERDDDAPKRSRGDEDDDPPPRRSRGDDDDDAPRRRRDPDDEDQPRRRREG